MIVLQILNGLTFAALLFVVASGFTLIFGLLRVVNLAHGALYLLGGYIGFTVAMRTGSFVLGGAAAIAAAAAAGLILSEGLLRFVEGHDLRQVLLTLGVAFVLNDMALVLWGGDTFTVPVPDVLRGVLSRLSPVRSGRRHRDLRRAMAAPAAHPHRRADPDRRR
jgi:branched-chain amino acid transport system permease protein